MKDPDKLRHSYLYGKGFVTPFMVAEEFRQAGFFIKTMEEFIKSSTATEVAELAKHVDSLDAEEADEFWAWNYPSHWDDLIGARIRSAFCTQLCSQVESTLARICDFVQVLERCPFNINDVKGESVLARHRKYLSKVGKFQNPSPQLWGAMDSIFKLRNAFVHEQGYIGDEKYRSLATYLSSIPNIKISNNFVELQEGSCPVFLDVAKRFSDALFQEYEVLKKRLRAAENQPDD